MLRLTGFNIMGYNEAPYDGSGVYAAAGSSGILFDVCNAVSGSQQVMAFDLCNAVSGSQQAMSFDLREYVAGAQSILFDLREYIAVSQTIAYGVGNALAKWLLPIMWECPLRGIAGNAASLTKITGNASLDQVN